MLNIEDFETCIRDNLKDRSFGKDRADEIMKDFRNRADAHIAAGRSVPDAATLAMKDTFERISQAAIDKARGVAKTLQVQADMRRRLNQAKDMNLSLLARDGEAKGSRGVALGQAVKSIIEHDPRFKDAPNYVSDHEMFFRQFFGMFDDALDKVRVGVQGIQLGTAHLPNIIRENFGDGTRNVTGDIIAKHVSDAWMRIGDLGPKMFNENGGAMNSLKRYTPQPTFNPVKAMTEGKEAYVKDHVQWGDWDKIRHPDGSPILPAERIKAVEHMYDTRITDGASKIDPDSMRGQGRAFGNKLNENRWYHFKDADGWLAAQDKYGDGNAFTTMVNHIDGLAHSIAVVKNFGRNPEMAFTNMSNMAKSALADMKGELNTRVEVNKLDHVLNNTVEPMMERVMRANVMNPESRMAAWVNSSTNVINASLLGATTFVHGFGSIMNTKAIRFHNDMPLFGGMATILHSWVSDEERLGSQRSGMILDQTVHAMHSMKTFNPVANVGVNLSRRIADSTLRATGLTGLFSVHRWSTQKEMMGLFHDMRGKEYKDVPWKDVMAKYGVGAPEWDAFRNGVKPTGIDGKGDGLFMRPIDLLNQNVKNGQNLFNKFQYMLLQESKNMTPGSSMEASVALKGNTRPDTMMGAMLNSFGIFKNFPITYMNMYGRMAMSIPSARGRLGFLAAVAACSTLGGAMTVQAKELKNGRDLIPMFGPNGLPNPSFWGKAFLTGGGAGIYGDFLFPNSNASSHGDSLKSTIAGPLPEVAGSALDIVGELGKNAKDLMTGNMDWDNYNGKVPEKVVHLLRQLDPVSNLWYTQTPFQRMFWDSMENAADPGAYQKRQTKMNNQQQNMGNSYYWPLGDRQPERAPDFKLTGGQ